MAFDWSEYLSVAKHLQQHESNRNFSAEAGLRSAISRAYYAAFCHARNFAQQYQDFKPTAGPQDHKLLRKHFIQIQQTSIASNLNELRQWRNKCDYNNSVENLDQLIEAAIQRAEDIFNELNSS